MLISQDVIDRFMSKVNTNTANGCWEWTKAKWSTGYGVMTVCGVGMYAHRLSYMIFKGEIPDGMFVCHSCDNPGCVNPEHLWIGTPSENAQDREHKQRRISKRGEDNHWAKLSTESVQDIKRRAAAGEFQTRLAKEYGVCRRTVVAIVAGETWRHLK